MVAFFAQGIASAASPIRRAAWRGTTSTSLQMNLADRFMRVAKANINNILQTWEDPEKVCSINCSISYIDRSSSGSGGSGWKGHRFTGFPGAFWRSSTIVGVVFFSFSYEVVAPFFSRIRVPRVDKIGTYNAPPPPHPRPRPRTGSASTRVPTPFLASFLVGVVRSWNKRWKTCRRTSSRFVSPTLRWVCRPRALQRVSVWVRVRVRVRVRVELVLGRRARYKNVQKAVARVCFARSSCQRAWEVAAGANAM